MPDPGELYVGYLPRAPRGIAGRIRATVIFLLIVAATIALLLVSGQRHFDSGVFEFGVVREFSGTVREHPYPSLQVTRPGSSGDGRSGHSTYFLALFGKYGAAPAVAGLDGHAVTLSGSLIYRDGGTIIQVEPDSVRPTDGAAAPAPRPVDLGEMTLVGEIVDSKCYWGTMKPAALKPHRSCAAACIRGGIPPVLRVADQEGHIEYFLLVSDEGSAVNAEVLDYVAEAVSVTGRVVEHGDVRVLMADPDSYHRLAQGDGS